MNKGIKSLLTIPLAIIVSVPFFFLFSYILAIVLEITGLKTKAQNLGDSTMGLMVYILCLFFTLIMLRRKPKIFWYTFGGLVIIFIILFMIYAIFFPNPPQPIPANQMIDLSP